MSRLPVVLGAGVGQSARADRVSCDASNRKSHHRLAQTFSGLRFQSPREGSDPIIVGVLRPKRYFHPGALQFITASTYRRIPLFKSPWFCHEFVRALDEARKDLGFLLLGWVLMPDHFHMLIKADPPGATSRIIQQLKQGTAYRILQTLEANAGSRWCQQMLRRLRLPETARDKAQYRVWQRRFYPFNVYSEKKRLEKLNYMHGNPVARRLVASPDQWPWSSFRFYHLKDESLLRMDRLP